MSKTPDPRSILRLQAIGLGLVGFAAGGAIMMALETPRLEILVGAAALSLAMAVQLLAAVRLHRIRDDRDA